MTLFERHQSDPNSKLEDGDETLSFWEIKIPEAVLPSFLILTENVERYRPRRDKAWREYQNLKAQQPD